MFRTRTLYRGGGIIFKFKAAMVTTMGQIRVMIRTSMISEGEDIASKMDAVIRETALPGSHNGLGSSAMLHHECRHGRTHRDCRREVLYNRGEAREGRTEASGQDHP
jgi:hypothetical protein